MDTIPCRAIAKRLTKEVACTTIMFMKLKNIFFAFLIFFIFLLNGYSFKERKISNHEKEMFALYFDRIKEIKTVNDFRNEFIDAADADFILFLNNSDEFWLSLDSDIRIISQEIQKLGKLESYSIEKSSFIPYSPEFSVENVYSFTLSLIYSEKKVNSSFFLVKDGNDSFKLYKIFFYIQN